MIHCIWESARRSSARPVGAGPFHSPTSELASFCINLSESVDINCVSTNTHRAPPCGLSDARAFTSYRIGKEHPHDPDILSVRQDCPTLAGVSGKWSLLDGRSAIATGWFPSLSSGFALFSDEIS